jgi:hypothetical protein
MQIIYILVTTVSVFLTFNKPLIGIIFLLFNFLLQPHILFGFTQVTTQASNVLIGTTLVLLLPFRKIKFTDSGISILATLFFISGAFSSLLNLGVGFLSIPEQYLIFWMGLNRLGFLLLFVRYVCTRKDFTLIFKTLVVLGGATAVYTVTDYYFHFTYDPTVKAGRAVGLFGDPNSVASNLAALVPLTYYLFLHGTSNWLRKLYLINIGSLVMGVFCTASRAGFLALLIIGAYITKKNIKKFSTPFVIGSMILLFVVYGRDLYLKREAKVQTVSKTLTGKTKIEGSAYSRVLHIQYGILLWLKNPVFGVGVSNAPNAIQEQLGLREVRAHIHNTYFSVLAEYGSVGFLLYMSLFFLAFRSLARLSKHKDPYYKEIAPYLRLSLLSHMFTSFFIGNWVELMQWIAIALPVILDQISKFEQQTGNK